jgi:hypothetical protein
MPRPSSVDWSQRVDRILSRWNRLGKPEKHREAVAAMAGSLTAWSDARNRLIAIVEELERQLSLEEHK